jgi:hypothetical protein
MFTKNSSKKEVITAVQTLEDRAHHVLFKKPFYAKKGKKSICPFLHPAPQFYCTKIKKLNI